MFAKNAQIQDHMASYVAQNHERIAKERREWLALEEELDDLFVALGKEFGFTNGALTRMSVRLGDRCRQTQVPDRARAVAIAVSLGYEAHSCPTTKDRYHYDTENPAGYLTINARALDRENGKDFYDVVLF